MAKKAQRKVAMCLMAHPDDCEFMVAGTLALLAKRGWEVHIVSSTPGDCGSAEKGPEEISRIRRQENINAAAIIGATYHCLELRERLQRPDRSRRRRTSLLLCRPGRCGGLLR